MRKSINLRETNETKIEIELNLDKNFEGSKIETGVAFFDHMLEQLCFRGNFFLKIKAKSKDSNQHHLVEDVAITLGEAILEALGQKRGIKRYASVILPMDEALALVALDFSGRSFCKISANINCEKVDGFETYLVSHFFKSFAMSAKATIHVNMLDGTDAHHIIEAIFKASGEALKTSTAIDSENKDKISSTKGVL